MTQNDRFQYLFQQYLNGHISTAEHDEFFELVDTHQYDELISQSIQNDLQTDNQKTAADLPPHIAQEIVRNIYHSEKSTAEIIPIKKNYISRRYWVAAASIALIVIASYLFFTNRNQSKDDLSSVIAVNFISEQNTSDVQRIITLKDGSIITLKPRSSIRYFRSFNDSSREVYLEGSAFFQVAKNPQKPFMVYYNHLVTRVLGTSFTINTNEQTGNVEVAVKTGRVQVYENEKLLKGSMPLASVILTPNQKAVYQVERRILMAELVSKPELVASHADTAEVQETAHFVYEQVKLLKVFRDLETGYGIEIVVDNTNLNNCVFTGDVSTGDLFTKLKIICLATNSSYEVNGTKILIKGAGCN